MMKPIVVVCPSVNDQYELLKRPNNSCSLHFHPFKSLVFSSTHETFTPQQLLEDVRNYCSAVNIEGVLTTDDFPGTLISSIIADDFSLPFPSMESIFLCQHKFYSRLAQKELIPEVVPWFKLFNPEQKDAQVNFPAFIKPVRSQGSVGAMTLNSSAELDALMQKSCIKDVILDPFAWFVEQYSTMLFKHDWLLLEEYCEGVQVTVEGFVFDGTVVILPAIDSIMYPDTISFERFSYPSKLDTHVERRMSDALVRFIQGIGFDHGFFNAEFVYNPENDRLFLLEVNPRMARQFADLYEKVDGMNSYDLLWQLSLGLAPLTLKNKGNHNCASVFVIRLFEDKMVNKVPTEGEIETALAHVPDARVFLYAQEGKRLSQIRQDGNSFRYAEVHVGGRDEQDLQEQYQEIKDRLLFNFS